MGGGRGRRETEEHRAGPSACADKQLALQELLEQGNKQAGSGASETWMPAPAPARLLRDLDQSL